MKFPYPDIFGYDYVPMTAGLLVCDLCGAAVPSNKVDLHGAFHENLRLKAGGNDKKKEKDSDGE